MFRTTNSVSSNKEHIGLTAGAFRFKSDERAEKRKQVSHLQIFWFFPILDSGIIRGHNFIFNGLGITI